MSREVNCMNCMVGRFKDDLCDEKMCEALKMIGESDDLVDIIMLAKELVRCKDCRYWKNFNNVQGICNERQNIITTEQYNDFCSHAERRKEEFVPLQEVELTEEAKAKMKGGAE